MDYFLHATKYDFCLIFTFLLRYFLYFGEVKQFKANSQSEVSGEHAELVRMCLTQSCRTSEFNNTA